MLLVAEARRVRELLLRRGDLRGQLVNGARQSHLREKFTPGSWSSFLSLVWWNPLRERPALRHRVKLNYLIKFQKSLNHRNFHAEERH